jgi:hypothetical protein
VGSAFLVLDGARPFAVSASGLTLDRAEAHEIVAHGQVGDAEITVEVEGESHAFRGSTPPPPAPVVLDGEWEFTTDDPNALVISEWVTTVEEEPGPERYARPDAVTEEWLTMVPGAWAHQLPAEPARFPTSVWYRAAFDADHVPALTQLVIDGWAGSDRRLFVNGHEIGAVPKRSRFDSQMKVVDITDSVRPGRNVVAIRMTLHGPTEGLLDRLKVLGAFALGGDERAGYRMVEPRTTVSAGPWTDQGYPYLSGVGRYRRTLDVSEDAATSRSFLEIPMVDDVVEVVVNGEVAGVCLWDPYVVEVTGRVRPGRNDLELRVANTAANLIGGSDRPSGLAGPPRLVAHREFRFAVPVAAREERS